MVKLEILAIAAVVVILLCALVAANRKMDTNARNYIKQSEVSSQILAN